LLSLLVAMQQRFNPKPEDRIFRIPLTRPWRVLLPIIPKPKNPASSSLILIYGFAAVIAIGTLLLTLPVASRTGQFSSPVDAFFTATSAVCVTGLVVVDTAEHWSFFGQVVILALIQIGGFGFMTSATLFLLAFGRRIGLREKILISESMGIERLGGVVKIVGLMALFTILTEAIGAANFYLHFSKVNPIGTSIWLSAFQSISSFNNAGFDLYGNFQSLSSYQNNPLILLVTAALIILGGISFLVVVDLIKTRNLSRLSLDSKLVLSTTALLLALGMVVILLTEFNNNETLGNLSPPLLILNAFFHSVTARTAGFSTINMGHMANYALFFMMFLMFIGGASGSTAGGVKVNNFSMLATTVWSTIRGREHPGAFGREFDIQQIHRALTVVLLSLGFVSVVVLLLTVTEGFRFIDLLFETVSAFGTVGLSTGITPSLSIAGRLIIIVTMFIGRLGPLTLMLALMQRQQVTKYRYPQETVRIG
jgi:trk system potassium uptake protein TrkH